MKNKKYPDWICNDCGVANGNWYVDGNYVGPSNHCATYHVGTCGCCGKTPVPVTEPRDYGHLRDRDHLKREKKTYQDLIASALNEFPFQKVRSAMIATEWKWFNPNGPTEVPSLDRMRECAKRLLTKVVTEMDPKECPCIGTGGFFATASEDGVTLGFTIAECESLFSDFQ